MIRHDPTIVEINRLWAPVYPHLARHLLERSGVRAGRVLDLGPFAGGIAVALLEQAPALEARVWDPSAAVLAWAQRRAEDAGVADRFRTVARPLEALAPEPGPSDLIAVRGAFFFLTPDLLARIGRCLAPGGFAWVGGGYGPGTPDAVIAPIADRSRALNAALGKRWVSGNEAAALAARACLADRAAVSRRGGLWIEVRG